MNSFSIIFSFIAGTLIGSFLNVVSLRYNTGMTLGGRSKCFVCGKGLKWYELVPVFSFIFQKGKCSGCKGKISWQYPVVELAFGAIFVLIFYKFPLVDVSNYIDIIFYILVSSLLMVITIYDIRHKIIPDGLVYTFAGLALLKVFVDAGFVFSDISLSSLLAGPVLALPFFCMWLLSKGTWMGLGDAKLVLGIGWTLGLLDGLSAVILAFWIGAVVSVAWMLVVFRKIKSRYEIPFGPYLVLGMYLVLFTGIRIIDFIL